MANIDLTIKTLDSRNHQFNISEELTVKELKEHIAGPVGTRAETQRLIYCGRVLQDEKKLSEYDLNGKVVHLVQRAPPSTNPPPSSSGPTRTPGARTGHIHYHLDRGFHNSVPQGYGPIPPPAGSSALLRLNTARCMLDDASQSLSRIATIPEGDGPLFVMDNTIEGNYSSAMPFAQAATAAALAAAFSTVQSMGGNNITVLQGPNGPPSVQGSFGFRVQGQQQSGGQTEGTPAPPAGAAAPIPPWMTMGPTEPSNQSSTNGTAPSTQQQQQQQVRNPRVSLFADVVEDVERIQQNLSPHLATIRQLLRDDPALDPTSPEYRRAQHTFNQVSESLHYMAHAFHAMSDLMVDFGAGAPREVRARPYVYQQAVLSSTIPIHASISVETTHSRPSSQSQQQPATAAPAGDSTPSSTPHPASSFVRQVARSTQHPSTVRPPTSTGELPSTPGSGSSLPTSWRATAPIGSNPNQPLPRAPTVTMVGGPHPFGRLPMAMTGGAGTGGGWTPVSLGASMSPMVFMEVRSSNGNHQEDSAPSVQSPGGSSSSSSLSDFDDFLPCHSRHLARLQSRSPETASRPLSAPASTTTASQTSQGGPVPHPVRPTASMTVPMPVTVSDLVSEMLRQATEGVEAIGGMESASHPPESSAEPALTNAMFGNLLQGVMQEIAGVMSGQQSTNTVAHFLRNIPDFSYAGGEAFLFDLFMNMAEHLTFRDLISLYYGVPEVLNRIRDHLRTFARSRLLDGGEFTETSIQHGVMLLVNQSLPLLQTAAAEANIRPDVDFVATMISFFSQRVQILVQLIGTTDENPNYGQQIVDHIRQSLTHGTALALSCFTDGVTSLERVFMSQLRLVSEGVHPMIQEWTTGSSLDRFRTLTASTDMDQLGPTVAPMVMNTERGRALRALWSAQLEEATDEPAPVVQVSPSNAEASASVVVATTAASATAAAPLAQEEESMIVEDDEPERSSVAAAAATCSSTSASLPTPRRPRLDKMRAEMAAHPQGPDSPREEVVIGSQPWHRDVPREWVPVIARDIQRQSRSPVTPAPLSDAYLAGIPNKRRKMAQGDRPNSNPQLLLRDTMERALRSANVSPPIVANVTSSALLTGPEVSAALLPELRRLGSARLDRDPDYEADRFPNADKYFHGV